MPFEFGISNTGSHKHNFLLLLLFKIFNFQKALGLFPHFP